MDVAKRKPEAVEHKGRAGVGALHYGVRFGLMLLILVILWLTGNLRVNSLIVH